MCNFVDRAIRVDEYPLFGIGGREVAVGLDHAFSELGARVLDPIEVISKPGSSCARISVEKDGEIRIQPVDGESIEFCHDIESETSSNSLVCQRRRDVTIADYMLASPKCRANQLVDMLRACRCHQKCLGAIGQLWMGRIEYE
jgi:hypothetical protein